MPKRFDLCDEQSHFHYLVPRLAQKYEHLRWAIFAVAASHLSCLPQYKTPEGISFHGLPLSDLSPSVAVECLLKCIPSLRGIHEVQGSERLESLVAIAVILRQLEEIEGGGDEVATRICMEERTDRLSQQEPSFLLVTNAVFEIAFLRDLFNQPSLVQAAYWMALRQEIYHSFTRSSRLKVEIPLKFLGSVSDANEIVLHTARVASWRWGDAADSERRASRHSQDPFFRNVRDER